MKLMDRLNQRSLIEQYCKLAVAILPVHESMLFRLYFKDGYSTIEISQLLMKRDSTIARRLKHIIEKLEKFRCEEAERLALEQSLRCFIKICPHCGYNGFKKNTSRFSSDVVCGRCSRPVNISFKIKSRERGRRIKNQ